jgi:outer membrane biosynthesis protein TonB
MDIRDAFIRRESRKRNLRSMLLTALCYALVLVSVLVLSSMMDQSIKGESGPIKIRIGVPSGSEAETMNTYLAASEPSYPEEPAIEAPPEEPAPPEEVPPPVEPENDSGKAKLVQAASPRPSAAPKPSKAPAKASPKPSAAPRPSAPAVAKTAASAAPVPLSGESPAPGAVPGPEVAVIKGSESGNSWESSFEGGSGRIGRSLYVPIVLYMPLPYEVPASYYEAIPSEKSGFADADARKKTFLGYYAKEGESYILKRPIPLADRPTFWLMLEDARYPLKRADYKKDKYLRPVTVRFRVGSTKGGASPVLLDVELKKSSGYSDIDEAVLFGFKQAAFSNDSERAVWGTFTYAFD